jgi:hypothetical protein
MIKKNLSFTIDIGSSKKSTVCLLATGIENRPLSSSPQVKLPVLRSESEKILTLTQWNAVVSLLVAGRRQMR